MQVSSTCSEKTVSPILRVYYFERADNDERFKSFIGSDTLQELFFLELFLSAVIPSLHVMIRL
jgi:hypothetical protein